MTLVVDTSVAIKWLVAEEGSAEAERLIGQTLFAPSLLLAEVANVAWKKWRRQEIDRSLAALIPVSVAAFVRLVPFDTLGPLALEIALELDHPVYDCYFMALARTLDVELVTADLKLVRRCTGTGFDTLVRALG